VGGRRIPRLVTLLPLVAPALVALLAGLWAGLLRLGIDVDPLRPELASLHGPLLVLGFLGTQIGLERAVALRRRWPYVVPAATAAGAVWLLVGLPADVGRALLLAGGIGLVAVLIEVLRIQPAWHNAVMLLGGLAWVVGAAAWLSGTQIRLVVPWLAAFLVLTIVGERMELSRMRQPPLAIRVVLLTAVAVFCVGVSLSLEWTDLGIRIAGVGLIAQAAWLARYDVARFTIRATGAPRYMAAALIAGYVWLAVGGAVWLWAGATVGAGFTYDAMVHAIFLGFVFSMVFAHAPVIVPAVLGVSLPYRPVLYVPLVLLHAGLVVRLAGDAAGDLTAWRWGGVMGEVAIVLFIALSATLAVRARRGRRPRVRGGEGVARRPTPV